MKTLSHYQTKSHIIWQRIVLLFLFINFCGIFPSNLVFSQTWGNDIIYGNSTTSAKRRALPVTASEAGSITSISIYHNGGGGARGELAPSLLN